MFDDEIMIPVDDDEYNLSIKKTYTVYDSPIRKHYTIYYQYGLNYDYEYYSFEPKKSFVNHIVKEYFKDDCCGYNLKKLKTDNSIIVDECFDIRCISTNLVIR